MNFFADWLSSAGISAADYARASGVSANTIYRRRRGELRTPPEVAYLLGELAKARNLGLEGAGAPPGRPRA